MFTDLSKNVLFYFKHPVKLRNSSELEKELQMHKDHNDKTLHG